MDINPHRLVYLSQAAGRLGPVREASIRQVGEAIQAVRTPFRILDMIPAHRGLRA